MIFIILVVKNRKDKNHMMDLEKKHQKEIDKVEASYTNTARQGVDCFIIYCNYIFELLRCSKQYTRCFETKTLNYSIK